MLKTLFHLSLLIFLVASFFGHPGMTFAQTDAAQPTPSAQPTQSTQTTQSTQAPSIQYTRGVVTTILEQQKIEQDDQVFYTQKLRIKKQDTHELIDVQFGTEYQPLTERQLLKQGTQVILGKQEVMPGQTEYVIADVYRLPILLWLLIGFFVLVVVIARWQGFFSILGMLFSLIVLLSFILPQILAGQNPVLVSLVGCGLVAALTIYMCHGFNLHSHLSLFSMFLTLCAVAVLSVIAVKFAYLAGLGSDEAASLQFGQTSHINLQGLLLGGIMLGTLGVLDDICVAQISIVNQLKDAKPHITFSELYSRGLVVGKDHVASLVNTLILAYAGSSLPLFLLFTMNQTQPAWVSLNSEIIAEEVVRTLIGSIGLVLAVPLATFVGSYVAIKHKAPLSHSVYHHLH